MIQLTSLGYLDEMNSAFPRLFKDFETRVKAFGSNDKVILFYKMTVANGLGNIDQAYQYYQEYRADDSDCRLDNCRACQINESLDTLMNKRMYVDVLRECEPIMEGTLSCGNVPKETYPHIISCLFFLDKKEEIKKYLPLALEKLSSRSINHYHYWRLLPILGIEKDFSRGVEIIDNQLCLITPQINDLWKIHFFFSCFTFFSIMKELDNEHVYLHILPDSPMGFEKSANPVKHNLGMLCDRFKKEYTTSAGKLYRRNGNDFLTTKLNYYGDEYKKAIAHW